MDTYLKLTRSLGPKTVDDPEEWVKTQETWL